MGPLESSCAVAGGGGSAGDEVMVMDCVAAKARTRTAYFTGLRVHPPHRSLRHAVQKHTTQPRSNHPAHELDTTGCTPNPCFGILIAIPGGLIGGLLLDAILPACRGEDRAAFGLAIRPGRPLGSFGDLGSWLAGGVGGGGGNAARESVQSRLERQAAAYGLTSWRGNRPPFTRRKRKLGRTISATGAVAMEVWALRDASPRVKRIEMEEKWKANRPRHRTRRHMSSPKTQKRGRKRTQGSLPPSLGARDPTAF